MTELNLDWTAPKSGDLPFTPITQIRLGMYCSDAIGPLLTAECVTPQELEWWVDYLKDQLDTLLAKAKKNYAKHDRKLP